MDELFTSNDFASGGSMFRFPSWESLMSILMSIVITVLIMWFALMPMYSAKKSGFTEKFQYLGASNNVIRDDTGFPHTSSLDEIYRSKQEHLVESGRYPNIYHSDSALDLSTQLALQNTVSAAASVAPKSSFTERMTPEEKIRREQASHK